MNRQARLSCRPRIKTYANDKKMKNRNKILFTSLAVLAVGLFAVDMMVGSVGIAPSDVWAALTGGECDPITRKIIIDIRLMKALVAILAGAALAVSGLQMQPCSATRWRALTSWA